MTVFILDFTWPLFIFSTTISTLLDSSVFRWSSLPFRPVWIGRLQINDPVVAVGHRNGFLSTLGRRAKESRALVVIYFHSFLQALVVVIRANFETMLL
jgi:hypothetical protein